jgi:hypothetical protein
MNFWDVWWMCWGAIRKVTCMICSYKGSQFFIRWKWLQVLLLSHYQSFLYYISWMKRTIRPAAPQLALPLSNLVYVILIISRSSNMMRVSTKVVAYDLTGSHCTNGWREQICSPRSAAKRAVEETWCPHNTTHKGWWMYVLSSIHIISSILHNILVCI